MSHESTVELSAFKWGLVTQKNTGKPDHFRMFNCRSEEMQSKPSFKHLVSRNRCIVLTEGFYEWKSQHFGGKQPYFVYFKSQTEKDVDIMPMAGLFDCWIDKNGVKLYTCTILTTSCSKKLSWLHDRMPLVLDESNMASWIDTETLSIPKERLQPYHGKRTLQYHKVSPQIGKLSFQGRSCCEEYGKSQKSILSMFRVKEEDQRKNDAQNSEMTVRDGATKRIKEDPGDHLGKKPRIVT